MSKMNENEKRGTEIIAEGVVMEMDYGNGDKGFYISRTGSATYQEDIENAIRKYNGEEIIIKIDKMNKYNRIIKEHLVNNKLANILWEFRRHEKPEDIIEDRINCIRGLLEQLTLEVEE